MIRIELAGAGDWFSFAILLLAIAGLGWCIYQWGRDDEFLASGRRDDEDCDVCLMGLPGVACPEHKNGGDRD